ncbi:hypothetical protein ACFFRR_004883 [Megaselia abdita]
MDRVTKSQKKLLISLLKEVKYIEGKKEREHYWEKIQASLNKIGPKKTIIQWKKCWRDMRLSTRKKLAEIKRSQNTSPPPGIEITQEDNDIIDIVGSEYFYDELGEIKTEPSSSFMPQFEYTPENLCDTILSINNSGGQQQHHKDSVTAHHHPQQEDLPHSSENNIFNFASPTSSVSSSSHLKRSLGHTPPEPFEDKILKLMQDTASYCSRKRANRQTDVDKLFLLSLSDDLKKIPEEFKLDVKSELIQVLKKWQNKSAQHYHQHRNNSGYQLPVTPVAQQQQQQQHIIDKNKKIKHEYTPQNSIVENQSKQTPSTSTTSHQQHQVNPHQQQQQQQQHKEPTAILPPPHQTLSHSQAISQGILFTTSMPQHPTLLTQVYGSAPSPINRTYENVG